MMSRILSSLLDKITHHQFSFIDAQELLTLSNDEDWDTFFSEFERFNTQKKPKHLKIYIPGKNFPAISVTGTECELHCEHCDRKYLHSMLPATSETEFREQLEKLQQQGTQGALLSGGCLEDGKVPLLKYHHILKEFKAHNSFFVNAHVGLISANEAKLLKECGIDTISFDLILDQRVITEVFHLHKTPEDYMNCYENLLKAGLRVIPHILIGAYFGKTDAEFIALRYLTKLPPELLVFISMIPPKEPIERKIKFQQVSSEIIARYILIARILFPNTELSLGCMRQRGLQSSNLERWAIQSGLQRMEIPSKTTIRWLEDNQYFIQYFNACCAVPASFETISQKKACSN